MLKLSLTLIATALVALAMHPSSPATAKIAAPEPVITVPASVDLGAHAPGTVVPTEVWLVNAGEETVEVDKARPTCGCTTVQFEPFRLQPGHARRVALSIKAPKKISSKTARVKFETSAGPLTWPITIAAAEIDAPPDADSAQHERGVNVIPGRIDLGEVEAGHVSTVKTWIINDAAEERRVTAAKGGCGCIDLRSFAPFTLAPGEAREFSFDLRAPRKAGSDKEVKVTLRVDGRDPLTLPVQVATLP